MHPGPMNRGVEIDPRVADHADALIETQVRAGLVTRMAVLYDLLDQRPGRGQGRISAGGGVMLFAKDGSKENIVVRGRARRRPNRGNRARSTCSDRRRASSPRSATELGHELASRRRRRRAGARAGVRRPARPSAYAGREDEETSRPAPPRRQPAATARSSRCRTPIRSSTRRPRSARWSSAREDEAEIPVGFLAAITKGTGRRRADGDGRARRRRRGRVHRRRCSRRVAPG